MQDIQDERYYLKSVSLSHDALLSVGFLGSHCGTGKWCLRQRRDPPRARAPAQGCGPRVSSGMVQIGMESHHHHGGFPAIKKRALPWLTKNQWEDHQKYYEILGSFLVCGFRHLNFPLCFRYPTWLCKTFEKDRSKTRYPPNMVA